MPTLLQVYRVNTVGADLHHLAPAVAERTPSERNLTHTTSALGSSLPRTPRTFAQIESSRPVRMEERKEKDKKQECYFWE